MADESKRISDVSDIIRVCAEKNILPYFQSLSASDVSFKQGNPNNKVSIADIESEKFLTREFQRYLSGSAVLGEEAAEDNPALFDLLRQKDAPVWVIDPVDGTANFVAGRETFCVMVALVENGICTTGWIYDVCKDEMYVAIKGQGAFCGDVRLNLSTEAKMVGQKGFTASKHARNIENMDIRTLRCAGHEYMNIAKGNAIFSMYRVMKPWDHLAGSLLVQEAGALTRKWDGSAYQAGDRSGGLITANNQSNWDTIKNIIPEAVYKKEFTT